jgi:hypothetical protein
MLGWITGISTIVTTAIALYLLWRNEQARSDETERQRTAQAAEVAVLRPKPGGGSTLPQDTTRMQSRVTLTVRNGSPDVVSDAVVTLLSRSPRGVDGWPDPITQRFGRLDGREELSRTRATTDRTGSTASRQR